MDTNLSWQFARPSQSGCLKSAVPLEQNPLVGSGASVPHCSISLVNDANRGVCEVWGLCDGVSPSDSALPDRELAIRKANDSQRRNQQGRDRCIVSLDTKANRAGQR